jgi:hypothetical protein
MQVMVREMQPASGTSRFSIATAVYNGSMT